MDGSMITLSQHRRNCWHSNFQTSADCTLEQTRGGPFAQILNSHWVLVSINLGCGKDVVHVYDTMYKRLPSSTINTIAGLAFCPLSELKIKMVDVDLQKMSSVLPMRSMYFRQELPVVCHRTCKDVTCVSAWKTACFPTLSPTDLDTTFKFTTRVSVYCVCHKPDVEDMAGWFHESCMDIPRSVFSSTKKRASPYHVAVLCCCPVCHGGWPTHNIFLTS